MVSPTTRTALVKLSGASAALADDAAGLGVADQEARKHAVGAAAAAGRHVLPVLHRQPVHLVQPPLQSSVYGSATL